MSIGIARTPCDEAVMESAPQATPCAKRARPWVLATTILGSSMAFIDGTAVNVALPVLQQDLKATAVEVQWIVEAYSLFLAALILVGGSLGDRLGRKRVYAAGVVLFTLASVACGLAPSIAVLIVARAVQGIGGALLVPGSLAIISAAFSGDARGRALGTRSGFATVTAALGPVLGGWLVQHVSWRAVFFINVPLAAVVLLLAFWRVPESRDDSATGPLDWWGALLATAGLGLLIYGLIEWGAVGLGQPAVLGALAAGFIALVLFVLAETRAAEPMMPLGLFRSRTFSGANVLTLLLYGALGGALYYLPFNLQQVQGYSATAAGAAFLPFTVLMFGLSRWAGGLVGRYGARLPLMIGPAIVAAGFVLFALPGLGGSYWTTYFPAVVVLGLGMTITVAPLTTAVMNAVEQRHSGVASGINNAVSRAAGLLAIAVLGIVVVTSFGGNLDGRLATLKIAPAARQALDAQRIKLGAAPIPAGVDAATHAALKNAIGASFVDSFRLAMLIGAGLALLSAVSAAVMIEGKTAAPASVGASGEERARPAQPGRRPAR